jgi:hypothetical protein
MAENSSSEEETKQTLEDPFARKKAGVTPVYNQGFGKKRKLLSQPDW